VTGREVGPERGDEGDEEHFGNSGIVFVSDLNQVHPELTRNGKLEQARFETIRQYSIIGGTEQFSSISASITS